MTSRNAVRRSVPKSALPDFTPVPRKCPRHDGWTPERQRAFIAALADTGCVKVAARMVNMAHASAYELRREPGAESFRAAWDAAQSFGLQVVKDEGFDRAMNGQLVPVFVGGKLMGFRRVKNDRLLMFILRHYGQDGQGRKTTVNYFSTRATAGAANSPLPSGEREGPAAKRREGEGTSRAIAAAEASTTTVKTVISGSGAPSQLAADDEAANVLNAFEGVELDSEARADIYRTLEACAERRRALERDPEDDPERFFIGAEETAGYLGELESGVEDDWIEYRPEGEHRWESLGEGGQAAEIDRVVAEIEERRSKLTPEQIAAEKAEDEAERARMREARMNPAPPKPEPDPDDPRLDWRNWESGGYVAPQDPPRNGEGDQPKAGGGPPEPSAKDRSPEPGRRARKRYKKRTPKPPFTPPDEARKAEAVAQVEADRRASAAARAERRRRRKGSAES